MARCSFLGLGVMGGPMAGHLLAAGHEVTVWNRTKAKAGSWVKDNPTGAAAENPKDAVIGADVVLTCLGDDPDVEAIYDEILPVAGPEGIKWARELAAKEGIMTGISGGSTFAVARQIAEKAEKGTVILCMLPDTAERYMSTPLFESIPAEMDDEEAALAAQ